MMIKNLNKKPALEFALIILAITAVIVWGKECSGGALKGIYFCAEALVPSLFPFMVISVFIAKSGLARKLGRYTDGLSAKLFGVSGNLSAVIIMSMIGGYPVGARGISALRESGAISENDAERASYFAVGAGPGFLITFVGQKLLSNAQIGVCMLLSQIISVIILGLLNKIIFAKGKDNNSYKEIKETPLPFTSAVTESVISSVYGTLEMCGMVVAFCAVIGITEKLFGDFNIYLSVLLEVTTACGLTTGRKNILLTAFAAGFGGLCVHFQIFTALRNIKIKMRLFFLYRIIQGLITAFLTYLFIKAFNICVPVFSSVGGTPELSLSSNFAGSALLIICGIGFLFSIKQNYKN